MNEFHQRPFDAERWRAEEQMPHDALWPSRLCMVDDLLASGQLLGLSSNQVVERLGPPLETPVSLGTNACVIHYYLGPERGFIRIDSEWLFIQLGPDGKVNRQWIDRD